MTAATSINPMPMAALELAAQALGDLEQWRNNCHAAALKVVRSGAFGRSARVARGYHLYVDSQHSWVAVGDPYDPKTFIYDPTLWTYCHPDTKPAPVYGTRVQLGNKHVPKGDGYWWQKGPIPVALKLEDAFMIETPMSAEARQFLDRQGPLDIRGWHHVATMPVGGWPAAEIVAAMRRDKRTRALVPIDVVGMLTDENPQGLYR